MDAQLIDRIRNIYKDTKCYIAKDNLTSEFFNIGAGLRQGGVLSPTLFIVIMDDIIKKIKDKTTATVKLGYYKLQPVDLTVCAFADDVMICATNEDKLQESLNNWQVILKQYNLKINVEKTKVMARGRDAHDLDVIVNSERLEQVDTFKYLGVKICKNGSIEHELNDRITSAANTYHVLRKQFLNRNRISRNTKMTVYRTIFRPVLTYGSESWTLTNTNKSRLQAIDMKYLRAVKKVTRLDRIPNDVIRRELEVEHILDRIEQQQLKWYGHLNRMGDSRQVKRIWEARTYGRSQVGRPQKKWNDEITKILSKRDISWNEAREMSRNKKEWINFLYG